MSKSEQAESSENKFSLPLSTMELIISVVDSIRAKGGHCSRDVLKTSVGKSDSTFAWALSSAMELTLVDSKERDYSLSQLGDSFASADEPKRKKIIREVVSRYQPYHTVLIRLKNAPKASLAKSDVTKAWYDLNKSGTDSTRQSYTASFANICGWCGLVENRKKTVALTEEGENLVAEILPPEEPAALPIPPSEAGLAKKDEPQEPVKPSAPASAQLTTAITINISVDAKEQASVDNLLRIIKALKGENGNPQT